MKLVWVIAIALIFVPPAQQLFCQTQPSIPFPAYTVQISGVCTTAMSPDEKYLAALAVKGALAEVQLWDFRSGRLTQSHSLSALEPRSTCPEQTTYLRYTGDGQLLAAYPGGDLLHILQASNLEEIRRIRIRSRSNVTGLVVSPNSRRLAIRMFGDVGIYDLDSGELVGNWTIHQPPQFEWWALLKVDPQFSGSGLAWNEDGTTLAMSVADNPPCLRGGGTIYILDVAKPAPPKSFRVALLPSTIAFGVGNSLYVASNTCGGYFSHWRLDLPVFDSTSGRETGKIPADKVGIRNYITISANRKVLLAEADREKLIIEGLEDTLKIEDAQWQVWDLATKRLILTLPRPTRGGACAWDSLSSSGRFVYGSRGREICIFSVPLATN
jgi:WD40 repeat protein